MASVNKVILIGRLGANPEIKYLSDGKAVTKFNLATDESWKDKSGNKQTKTEWHKIVVFGKLAEICGDYLSKGKQVYLEGKLQTRSWEQDGEKKYITEVNVSNMVMLGGSETHQESMPAENSEDDIPF